MDTPAVPLSREHHGGQSGDAMRREEQLRTTLHYDDKEKLRRKLALLQREYLRTAERLQRAERLDAVRRHVRSRIGRQDQDQDQRDPEETPGPRLKPSPWVPNATNGTAPRAAPCPGHAGAVSDASRKSPVIRFLLPSAAVGPQTPDPRHDTVSGHRPSPALRLRSRRSRLRWERRSAEAGGSADDHSEEPRERCGRMETDGAEGCEGGVRAEAANESEEPLSCDDSESPSLLLPQWNAPGAAGAGGNEGEETRERLTETDAELPRWTGTGARRETEEGGKSKEDRDGRLFEGGSERDAEQMAAELREREKGGENAAGIREEESELTGGERDGKGASPRDSCTLREGLLYPAEYYVRTTRRMTLSQSQPDTQAVVFSQLSAGQHRAGRGRGPTRLDRRTAACSSSPTSGELNGHSSRETADPIPWCEIDGDARVPPPIAAAARPARGRRTRRGRGRGGGRTRTPRRPLIGEPNQQPGLGTTSDNPRAPAPPPHGAEGPGQAAAARDEPEAASACRAATPPSPGETQPGSASGHAKKVFPIFLRSEANGSRQTSAACWRSLLLPSSPPASTAVLPVLPRPPQFPAPVFNNLLNFDFPQDFHLPDEQFASLKLLKLRQVAADPGVARLTPRCTAGDPAAELPRSLTATLPSSPRPATSSPIEEELVKETEETPRGDAVEERVGDHEEGAAGSPDRRVETAERESASSVVPSEGRTDAALEDPTPTDHRAARPQRPPEEPSDSADAVRLCNHGEAAGGSPRGKSPTADSKEPSDPPASPPSDPRRSVPSQLLLSPPGPSMTPRPPSRPAVLCSPTLPSLGLSPHPLRAAVPVTSSPSAPSLTSSPAALVLSPSPPVPPGRPAASPAAPIEAPSSPLCPVEPTDRTTAPGVQSKRSGGGAEEHVMRSTHTLKAPAGRCLVDACCLRGSSGALCVAAAAEWTVCLWSQTSAADWGLTHTWAFSKPVISVFPVPDAAGLMCVTLGPLEITEVRVLSCSRLSQAPLCEGVVQAVVGAPESRVVASSHSPSGSTLRVFAASDGGRWSSQPLASPGVCVGSLAPVDGLSDALIGSDDGGRLFVWNLKTGQLLRRIALGDGLSHASCLRGFSSRGALFVLLQHQQLGSPEDGAKKDEDERQSAAPLSLVAVNPLSGRSALASRLRPPEGWSGRLCEADVGGGGGVVGLSRSGCVCVWELGGRAAPRMVGAPGSDGWQLARWGDGGTLVTGHHNGDVTLHGRAG
ncbi:uncharacterized protein palb2 isoform X3 [Gasterosteus aculeatus]